MCIEKAAPPDGGDLGISSPCPCLPLDVIRIAPFHEVLSFVSAPPPGLLKGIAIWPGTC